ncbi:DedA family protein [Corynebacterium hylobatis]|uniref:DedA family protein n=1 Tax=Corynebacterium hylobatis TaxID=1859290 RepID=A0A430I050_9CORY|nr:DedA family protein [Corynebacterium hylobatis]RSZ64426.1 DedA family protein [Corynebacterium hylobatis]
MTEQIVTWVETLLTLPVFYPVLAGLVILDSLLPLIPSEAVLTLAGSWSGSRGVPDLLTVIQIAVVGAVVGDNICYLLGTRLIRFVESVPADSARGRAVAWVRGNIRRNAATTIIVARFIPWARWFMTIMLGSVRYPWRWFFLYDTIGVVIWALQAVLIGYLGGWIFSDYPLVGMIVGITLGTLVGLLVQRVQDLLYRRRQAGEPARDQPRKQQ